MSVIVPQGLVGYYPLDLGDMNWGGNTTYDRSGYGNNGTLLNITSARLVRGVIRQALSFNGTNMEVQASPARLSGLTPNTKPVSIAHWLWWDSTTTQVVTLRDHSSVSGTGLLFPFASGGNIIFRIGGTNSASSGVTVASVSNKWTHWALVSNISIATLYLNATPIVTAVPGSDGIRYPFHFMENGSVGGSWQKGFMDDVRFADRAWTAQEVKSIYVAGLGGRAWNSRSSRTAIMAGQDAASMPFARQTVITFQSNVRAAFW